VVAESEDKKQAEVLAKKYGEQVVKWQE